MGDAEKKIDKLRLLGLMIGSVGALVIGHTAYVCLAGMEVFSVFTGFRAFAGVVLAALGWGLIMLDRRLKEEAMDSTHG